jgi:hypothetical protein
MEKIQPLPTGSVSASGRYWCVTCKKLFKMEQPVCPYMTARCVNSPIALEKFVPESPEWLEKMGLFYPKIPPNDWKFEFGKTELREVQDLLGLS